jgi:hypothetical protein
MFTTRLGLEKKEAQVGEDRFDSPWPHPPSPLTPVPDFARVWRY